MIDTNVFVAGLRSGGGASRQILRRALDRAYLPLFSNALWLEYEDMLARPIWTGETSPEDRVHVLAALAAAGRWVKIYYGWRPNLRDPGDDFLIELAVAGGARAVITHNVRDLRHGELHWPGCPILTPSQCLEKFP
ncbi:MAG TPA: putative toxin-antitoxin system toxin component, PIN family [Acetobacteraceae bacterium]